MNWMKAPAIKLNGIIDIPYLKWNIGTITRKVKFKNTCDTAGIRKLSFC